MTKEQFDALLAFVRAVAKQEGAEAAFAGSLGGFMNSEASKRAVVRAETEMRKAFFPIPESQK